MSKLPKEVSEALDSACGPHCDLPRCGCSRDRDAVESAILAYGAAEREGAEKERDEAYAAARRLNIELAKMENRADHYQAERDEARRERDLAQEAAARKALARDAAEDEAKRLREVLARIVENHGSRWTDMGMELIEIPASDFDAARDALRDDHE